MDEINDLYVYFKSNYRKPEDNEFYGVVTGFVKNKEILINGKTFTSDVYKCDIFPGQGIEIKEGTFLRCALFEKDSLYKFVEVKDVPSKYRKDVEKYEQLSLF